MATAADLRRLALALADAAEVPHVDRAAFRTPRRIFVTLAPDEFTANLMLDPMQQELLVAARPDAFAPVPGGWGAMGATTVTLAKVSVPELHAALIDAHARASAPKKASSQKTARKTTPRASATKANAKPATKKPRSRSDR